MYQKKNATVQECYIEQMKCLKGRKDQAIPVTACGGP
jgi:hypothetical protein